MMLVYRVGRAVMLVYHVWGVRLRLPASVVNV
jgi:hypothetical protein